MAYNYEEALFNFLKENDEYEIESMEEINHFYDNTYSFQNHKFLILNERELDSHFKKVIYQYIDDCILTSETPKVFQNYFDYDKYLQDARIDGYATFLSFDGNEYEAYDDKGNLYFIFKVC